MQEKGKDRTGNDREDGRKGNESGVMAKRKGWRNGNCKDVKRKEHKRKVQYLTGQERKVGKE